MTLAEKSKQIADHVRVSAPEAVGFGVVLLGRGEIAWSGNGSPQELERLVEEWLRQLRAQKS